MAISSRGDTSEETAPPATITSSPPDTHKRPGPRAPTAQPTARTRAGAIEAAVRSITAFDGDVLLKPVRLRAVVARIAARASRLQLIAAFDQASARTRGATRSGHRAQASDLASLGSRRVPSRADARRRGHDRGLVRGHRRQRRHRRSAAIVANAGRLPRLGTRSMEGQLVRELSGTDARPLQRRRSSSPGELFTAIPRFEEFQHAAR